MHKQHDYQFHALLHSADLVEDRLREKLTPLDIRPKQARVLSALDILGSVSQAQLAREIYVTAGSMSTMVTRLEKLGLISRARHPDERRSDVLSLTEVGKSQLKGIHQTWKEMDEYIEKTIGHKKALMLLELTEELRLALGGQVPGDKTRD
ncbi:MarR family winged helix-turn-helix transcriptional regulator [Granulosicoccus antarcticus]|uniref:Multiple antibiotic resistance protein MarR n=1 Tax=Granulosicoccus antarcticus IMCC3135 TaxID=1192854 RepID=A0A2Z2NU84_9GAMM|nr:MarR family transcriptional regulator [Granulosicoccus antarcticus]ASJ74813.1 Multiple antibiotic resistance protein MarR [Granulosicoccus antarcticus IMCC3135]